MLSATESPPLPAVNTLCERHGRDEIIIITYAIPDGAGYTYSVQCRLGRFVRSAFPHQLNDRLPRQEDIQRAAVNLLRQWTRKSRAAKNRLREFDLLAVGQREFDFGAD